MEKKLDIFNKYFPIFFVLIWSVLFIKFYPGEILISDEAVKIKQIQDFLSQKTTGISCYYPAKEIDPNYTYFPSKPPMFRVIDKNCYYPFPYFFTFLLLPFYLIGNIKAIYILTFLIGVLSFYFSILLGNLFFQDQFSKAFFQVLVSTSMGLLYYSLKFNDHIFSCCLITLGLYLYFKENPNLFLSGLCLSLATTFRQETLALGFLLIIYDFIKNKKFTLQSPLVIGFGFIVFLSIGLNLYFFKEPLGIRGIEVKEKLNLNFLEVVVQIKTYFFGNGLQDRGHFLTFPLYLFGVFSYLSYKKHPQGLIFLTLPSLILVSVLVKIDPFGQFGERYLFFLNPLLLILSCSFIIKVRNHILKKSFIFLSLIFATYTFSHELKSIQENSNFLKLFKKESEQHFLVTKEDQVVILRSLYLNYFFLNNPNPNQIVFLAEDDKKFQNLIMLLKENGFKTISVLYPKVSLEFLDSKEVQRHNSLIPKSIVPKESQTYLKPVSVEKGTPFVEIRSYEILY